MNQNQNIPNLFPDIRFALFTHISYTFFVKYVSPLQMSPLLLRIYNILADILTWTYHYVHMFVCKTEIDISYKIQLEYIYMYL